MKKQEKERKIVINDKYSIEVTQLNYTLIENIEGNKHPRIIGYYSGVQACLREVARLLKTEGQEVNLDQYIEELDAHEQRIADIVSKLNRN